MDQDARTLPTVSIAQLQRLIDDPKTTWEPLRPGIEIHWLYRWSTGQSAGLLRYAPGATLPRHRHGGTEQIFVLQGSQQDDNGTHPAGTLLVNPAGTTHAVRSTEGCIVLAIWEQPVVFEQFN